MNVVRLFLPIILFVFVSCNSDDETCTRLVSGATSLEAEYNCTHTTYQLEIDLVDDYMIIKNQLDYTELVMGDCQPEIDFLKYDLVIGKKGLSSGNTSIDYRLTENCGDGNQTLYVTFHQNATSVAPNLTYHALVPKLTVSQRLNVDVTVSY